MINVRVKKIQQKDEFAEYKLPGLDVAIVPNFCEKYLGTTPTAIWDEICGLEKHDTEADLSLDDGWNPKLLSGTHPALHMRGNPLRRTKLWLQSDFDSGFKRYGYTGWQWRVAHAQRRIESMPIISEATVELNKILSPAKQVNHAIVTIYEDSNDNIGLHSDKMVDFKKDTGFIVLKLGEARRFQFANSDGVVFYDEPQQPGTAIIVGADANMATKHGVPKDASCKGASGSIVWRNISTVIPWHEVNKKIALAKYK
jgi:hypothetical protein